MQHQLLISDKRYFRFYQNFYLFYKKNYNEKIQYYRKRGYQIYC